MCLRGREEANGPGLFTATGAGKLPVGDAWAILPAARLGGCTHCRDGDGFAGGLPRVGTTLALLLRSGRHLPVVASLSSARATLIQGSGFSGGFDRVPNFGDGTFTGTKHAP